MQKFVLYIPQWGLATEGGAAAGSEVSEGVTPGDLGISEAKGIRGTG